MGTLLLTLSEHCAEQQFTINWILSSLPTKSYRLLSANIPSNGAMTLEGFENL